MKRIAYTTLSKIFKNAISRLIVERWDSREPSKHSIYICHAIILANTDIPPHKTNFGPRIDAAISIIDTRLEHIPMSSWLRKKGIPEEDLSFERVQAHRLAWINMLVEEFDKPGYYYV